MVQELVDLRASIAAGCYEDALAIIDDLEGMSKQAIIRNIESFLIRMIVHLVKNQVEQRLTNSWAASIADSLRQINKLNLKDNKKSYYIKENEWLPYLEEALEAAIIEASIEVRGGIYNSVQLKELVNGEEIMATAQKFLDLTYVYSGRELLSIIQANFAELPGGETWQK